MADAPVTLRTRKFIRNPLLARKQMVVYVLLPLFPAWLRYLSLSPHPFEVGDETNVLTKNRDVLHPNRPNVSKDELRDKLSDLYKSNKDQVSVFGFRTQYGGGKSTGFALVYDSHEAMKKFEPHFRLVRVGAAQKVEKASRQQRTSSFHGYRQTDRRIYLSVWIWRAGC